MFDVKKAISNIEPDPDWEKFQDEQRRKLSILTSTEVNAEYGRRQVELGLKRFTDLEDEAERDFELTRMAEGYALQGDYESAVSLTKSDIKKQEYLTVMQAVENSKSCDCPQKKKFTKEIVLYKGERKSIIYCTACRSYSS